MKKHLALFLTAVIVGNQAIAQPPVKEDKKLAAELDKMLGAKFRPNGPGCVMLVARKGEVIYRKAFGMADLELSVPMKPENVFRIASLTKQFTAVAILQLAEKGLLSVNDDIRKYIADYPTTQPITIANLLSHTSGIKNITETALPSTAGLKDNTPAELVDMIKSLPPDFAPGTSYRYSNSGYILLGYILEKITGKTYEQYLNDNIFKPLGMDHAYYDHARPVIANRARGYAEISDKEVNNAPYLNQSFPYAAGALMMTVDDFFKWETGLATNKIVKKETLTQALTRFTLANGSKTTYGFGWGLDSLAGSAARMHGGSINGFATFQVYLPAEDVYVVTLSNSGGKNVAAPSFIAASLAAGKQNFKEITVPELTLTSYLGTYKFPEEANHTVTVSRQNGKMIMRDNMAPEPWEMHFTSPNDFFCYEVFPNNHKFTLDSTGKVDGFLIQAGKMEIRIKRVE